MLGAVDEVSSCAARLAPSHTMARSSPATIKLVTSFTTKSVGSRSKDRNTLSELLHAKKAWNSVDRVILSCTGLRLVGRVET